MNKEFTNQISDTEYLISIRGLIGIDISGAAIANEIDFLTENGATKIIEEINSGGGVIADGLNIVHANLRSTAIIETVNVGVAASMGAIILASGDIRKALDFSTALVHDPQLGGQTLKDIKDENTRSNLQKMKDSLVKILTDATGKTATFVSKLMTRETVLTPQEQKEFGLVDSVVKSRIKKPQFKNLSLIEYMNVCEDLQTKTHKKNSMENLTKFLKLNADASETSILEAVNAFKTDSDALKTQFEKAQDDLAQATQDLKAANEQLDSLKELAVTNAVNIAIDSGKFIEDSREKLTVQANKNLEFFNEMVGSMPKVHKSAFSEITNQKQTEGKEVKDWDYYQKNDPKGLKLMELTNLEDYKKLYEKYWGEAYTPSKK